MPSNWEATLTVKTLLNTKGSYWSSARRRSESFPQTITVMETFVVTTLYWERVAVQLVVVTDTLKILPPHPFSFSHVKSPKERKAEEDLHRLSRLIGKQREKN